MESVGKNSSYKSKLPLVVHRSVLSEINNFYGEKNRRNYLPCIGFYVYVYDAARRQGNNRVWLTDSFIMKGTGISKRLLTQIKKDLGAMGLIEIHHERREFGIFGKRYIEVKYVWQKDAIDKLFYQERGENTEYKIIKSLLTSAFVPYSEMNSQDAVTFDAEVNGKVVILQTDTFFFNEEYKLIAMAYIGSDGRKMEYTVPTTRIKEVLEYIASSYTYRLSAIMNALQGKAS